MSGRLLIFCIASATNPEYFEEHFLKSQKKQTYINMGGGGGRRRVTVGCFMFSLCWFTLYFLLLFYLFLFLNTMLLGIRSSNILCREWFLICLGPPQIFSKIKLVQNRAMLDTSGGLSWHNKRIDCPF